MFHLKRKSFFNYDLDEEVIIKKGRKVDQCPVKNNVGGHKYEIPNDEILNKCDDDDDMFMNENLFDYSDSMRDFSSESAMNNNYKRENKILKLLKFKNKRQNSSDSKVVDNSNSNISKKPIVDVAEKEVLDIPSVACPVKALAKPELDLFHSVLPLLSGTVQSPKKSRKGNSAAATKVNKKYVGSDGSFVCTECPFTTKYITHFEKHMKQVHPELQIFQCEICQYETKSKSYLTVHMLNHLGIKPYKCPSCDYASTRKDYLNLHMKSHSREQTFFCPECVYTTYRTDYLNRHIAEKHIKNNL